MADPTPAAEEVLITHIFDAPRETVHIDLRPGGRYRETENADRAGIFHAVEVTLDDGAASGRVFQAFAPRDSAPARTF